MEEVETDNASYSPSFDEGSGEEEMEDLSSIYDFERIIKITVPSIFTVIAVLGFFGNLLVMIVVASSRQMRSTTNVLIISLAIADLLFIVICVPFTAIGYAIPVWPFGTAWCKIYQYATYVTAYASVYTLVLMSLDRYMAVVHPIRSITIRTERNAIIISVFLWATILACNYPVLVEHNAVEYLFEDGEPRSACLNEKIYTDTTDSLGQVYYSCFFAFAYVLPLTLVCVLYGLMVRRLLYGGMGGDRARMGENNMRNKKRVTRMVVIVVLIFAVCWLPLQIVLVIQFVAQYTDHDMTFVVFKIFSNCLAYMNSCVNPFLYAFLSENFRKSFRRIICCCLSGNRTRGSLGKRDKNGGGRNGRGGPSQTIPMLKDCSCRAPDQHATRRMTRDMTTAGDDMALTYLSSRAESRQCINDEVAIHREMARSKDGLLTVQYIA